MKIIVSQKDQAAILHTVDEGTFYQSQQNSGASPKVEEGFFNHVKGKTLEVEILDHSPVIRQGRNNSAGIATTDVVWKSDVTMKAGNFQSKVRIQFADLVACANGGGKGIFTFGTYTPEGKSNTYLVPVCSTRCTPIEVAAYVKEKAEVTV